MKIYTFFVALVTLNVALHAESKSIPAKDGQITMDMNGKKITVPIFPGADTPQVDIEHGIQIRYNLEIKDRAEGRALAKKFAAFYEGKKIFGKTVPKFKEEDPGGPGYVTVARNCDKNYRGLKVMYFAQFQMMGVMISIDDRCEKPKQPE